MSQIFFTYIYFFYGLAFTSMGMAILLEYSRASDDRLRHALRPLAVFGLVHGAHEWIEMFDRLGMLPWQQEIHALWDGARLAMLAFSFLSLAAFGSSLLANSERTRRISLIWPLVMAAVWGLGAFIMRGVYSQAALPDVIDVWTRYTLALPGSLAASAGLVAQQRRFRQAGMAQFGRDALWSAVALFWYGVIGQTFVKLSPLWPSTFLNVELFQEVFGFPVQLLRSVAAIITAVFVIRFLRSFEVEVQQHIEALQRARLAEAEHRQELRGELLRRVVEAQEAERQRIARELHDETGQALTALGLGLRGVAGLLRHDSDKAAAHLRNLEGMAAQSLNELQRLISDLRPSHLDDLGLPAALRWYCNEVANRTGLLVSVEFFGEQRELTPELRTALFRIIQEALNNITKHAHARSVHISLGYAPQAVTVSVIDDGRGFDPERQARVGRRSWGLEGMRERATLLGGQFSVQSAPRLGTQVLVSIPYQPKEEEHIDEDQAAVSG